MELAPVLLAVFFGEYRDGANFTSVSSFACSPPSEPGETELEGGVNIVRGTQQFLPMKMTVLPQL